jgi:RNA polymerase sigma-70 factor (ECF subfamily)
MSDRTHPLNEDAQLTRSVTELYDTLRRFFLRHLRTAEREDADDLVQDVFVHLANRGSGETVERADAYVFVTATNVLRDRSRRRIVRRAGAHEPFDEDLHTGFEDRTPERVLVGKQSVERVQTALLKLPERTRTVFLLYRFEQLQRAAIAARLGLSLSTVEKEIAKAVQHLAEYLEKSS